MRAKPSVSPGQVTGQNLAGQVGLTLPLYRQPLNCYVYAFVQETHLLILHRMSTLKVSIIYAAKLAGMSRQHFYTKYLNTGVLCVERDNPGKPVIDVSEFLRVFPNLKVPDSVLPTDGQGQTHIPMPE